MKEIQKAMITVLLVVSCMISLAAAAEMSVSQQPTGIGIGDTFTVDVTVDPMGDEIYGTQYDLLFDSSILSATTQTQGDFLSQNDAETFVVVNKIDNSVGKVTYSEIRVDFENGVRTSGTLSSITFEVIGDGISNLALDNIVHVTPDDFIKSEPEPSEEPPDDDEPEHYDALEEPDDPESSGSSNFAAAPAATAATPTAADDTVDSTTAAEAGSAPTTGPTGVVTPTKAATPDMPSQSGFKAPGFEAVSLVVVLLYLVKRIGR